MTLLLSTRKARLIDTEREHKGKELWTQISSIIKNYFNHFLDN